MTIHPGRQLRRLLEYITPSLGKGRKPRQGAGEGAALFSPEQVRHATTTSTTNGGGMG